MQAPSRERANGRARRHSRCCFTRSPAGRSISDHGDPIAILRPFKAYFPDVDLDLTESVGLFDFYRPAGPGVPLQPRLHGDFGRAGQAVQTQQVTEREGRWS